MSNNPFDAIPDDGSPVQPTLTEKFTGNNPFDAIPSGAPDAPVANPYLDELNAEYGTGGRLLVGMGQGFDKLQSGVQGIFRGDEYTERKQQEHADYQKSEIGQSGMGNVGEFVGNTAPA